MIVLPLLFKRWRRCLESLVQDKGKTKTKLPVFLVVVLINHSILSVLNLFLFASFKMLIWLLFLVVFNKYFYYNSCYKYWITIRLFRYWNSSVVSRSKRMKLTRVIRLSVNKNVLHRTTLFSEITSYLLRSWCLFHCVCVFNQMKVSNKNINLYVKVQKIRTNRSVYVTKYKSQKNDCMMT